MNTNGFILIKFQKIKLFFWDVKFFRGWIEFSDAATRAGNMMFKSIDKRRNRKITKEFIRLSWLFNDL